MLVGLVTYNAVSGAVLVWAAFAVGMVGVLLWPAVVYHVGGLPACVVGRWPCADDPAGTEL